jgi:hypothetical protein
MSFSDSLSFPNATNPVWAPNGKYLVFSSDAQSTGPGIYWMRADGSGEPRRLVEGTGLTPTSASFQAGILYNEPAGPKAGLWSLQVNWSDAANPASDVPQRLPAASMESPASLSPDGRWLVYTSPQLGLVNVFVRAFPSPGGPWQISNAGGTSAVWSRTGHELFYRNVADSRIMIASYTVDGDGFSVAQSRPWNGTPVERFDLMPDSQPMDSALRSSSPGPTLGCSGPNSPRSCLPRRSYQPHSAPHSTASNRESMPAASIVVPVF